MFTKNVSISSYTPEQTIIEFLQRKEAQQIIEHFFKNNNPDKLLHIFEHVSDNLLHPEIDQLFSKIDAGNSWNKIDDYFNDLLVIAYQELFDTESGKLKETIKQAINFGNHNMLEEIQSTSREDAFNKVMLEAYFIKMTLNSCANSLQDMIKQENPASLVLLSAINEKLIKFAEHLSLHQCHSLAKKCIAVGKSIAQAFDQWEKEHSSYRFESDQIESIFYNIKQIAINANEYILITEIVECEKLITDIKKLCPDFPIKNFQQIVDNGYDTMMKKEFIGHKAHTNKAYLDCITNHSLRQEVNQLQKDLTIELKNLQKKINIYYLIAQDDSNSTDLTYINNINNKYEKLCLNLPLVEQLLTSSEMVEQDIISLKLKIMSETISLSQAELLLHQKSLDARKDGKDEGSQVKIKTLKDFSNHLQTQKGIIDNKLQQPRIVNRKDISDVTESISDKRKEIQNIGFIHSSWFFSFLQKIGFCIATKTEKLIETIDKRLVFNSRPYN